MKVLLADDDCASRLLISRLLSSWGYEVVLAHDGAEALHLLSGEDGPQLAILDSFMPGQNAAEICARLRALAEPACRFVLALVPRRLKQECTINFDSAVDDYVLKPVEAVELKSRLKIACRVLDLENKLADAVERTRVEASHDGLTGLWNRTAILQFLHGQFARSVRDGLSVAAALGDLDHFKEINHRYGQQAGDAVLREVAARMRKVIRPYDWLGRYAGERFLAIASDCTLSNGFAMCERLRGAIAEKPFDVPGGKCAITISFGLATTAESGVLDQDALLRAADSALGLAKQNGRNRVEMAKRVTRARGAQIRPAAVQHRELVQ